MSVHLFPVMHFYVLHLESWEPSQHLLIDTECKRKRPNLHSILAVRNGKIWRRVESYHAYVPSLKRTLENGRGRLLVTDYKGHTI
jgi:hypothetical protein